VGDVAPYLLVSVEEGDAAPVGRRVWEGEGWGGRRRVCDPLSEGGRGVPDPALRPVPSLPWEKNPRGGGYPPYHPWCSEPFPYKPACGVRLRGTTAGFLTMEEEGKGIRGWKKSCRLDLSSLLGWTSAGG